MPTVDDDAPDLEAEVRAYRRALANLEKVTEYVLSSRPGAERRSYAEKRALRIVDNIRRVFRKYTTPIPE